MSAELSFANYTSNSQSCLIKATREAENLHHAQVQPEHLLLSLLSPESGTAWSLLAGTLAQSGNHARRSARRAR